MIIAICLLTCDRPAMTAITVRSFGEHNSGRSELVLLHADGGSQTSENCAIAHAAGFKTLVAPDAAHRIGQMATLHYFLEAARSAEADFIVWLENDWESVAPLPSEAFITNAGVDTIRLFGTRKARIGHRQGVGRYRIGTREEIEWAAAEPGWERGCAHWGGGGTIVRTEVLMRNSHLNRLKDVVTADPRLSSLRPVDNIMWSIGIDSTPGLMG